MLESHYYKDMVEAGCDEAGRGCLAGSVYAAAVILPPGYQNAELNDSKKLTDKKRKALREQIERDAELGLWALLLPKKSIKSIPQRQFSGYAPCPGPAQGSSGGSYRGW